MQLKPRQPWGYGPAALQKECRNKRARCIAAVLWTRLDVEMVNRTGELFPRGGLKRRECQALFMPWASALRGRIMTTGLACSVCRRLVVNLGNSPPRAPNQTYAEYIRVQAQRLRVLIRKARKMASSVDPTQLETQPLPPVPRTCLLP